MAFLGTRTSNINEEHSTTSSPTCLLISNYITDTVIVHQKDVKSQHVMVPSTCNLKPCRGFWLRVWTGPSSLSYLAKKLKCLLDTAFTLYSQLSIRSRSLTLPISSAETTLNKMSQTEMQFRDNKRRARFLKTEHSFPSMHSRWFLCSLSWARICSSHF